MIYTQESLDLDFLESISSLDFVTELKSHLSSIHDFTAMITRNDEFIIVEAYAFLYFTFCYKKSDGNFITSSVPVNMDNYISLQIGHDSLSKNFLKVSEEI